MHPTRVGETSCRIADSPADLTGHFAIRHEVFVVEQGIFQLTDRDDKDDYHRTIHLVGAVGSDVVGAVRLYPLDASGHVWQGDRLAVAPAFRVFHLGSALVQLAVASAARRSGHVMQAHIQLPNVRFFEHLGWTIQGPVEIYAGIQHQPMAINLLSLEI